MKRGRPEGTVTVNAPLKVRPEKFTETHVNSETGIKSIWAYDQKVTTRGPVSVEIIYPDGYISDGEREMNDQDSLPKTKRTYWSELTGKFVGYTRARALGLID